MTPAILIIDGDLQTGRVLRSALGTEGTRTWEASNGHDGLVAFAARCPQAVLLDLNLPNAEGLDVLASIRDSSDAPALAMSTHKPLLATVWGPEYVADVQHLRVFIRLLRCKLARDEGASELLLNTPRVGYRLRTPD